MTAKPKHKPVGGLIFYETPDGQNIDVYAFYDHERKEGIQPILHRMMSVVSGTFVKAVPSVPQELLEALLPEGVTVTPESVEIPEAQPPEGYA